MPRQKRTAPSGVVFHVINRGSRKGPLFETLGDYHAFELILIAGVQRCDVQLFAYCLMPNHWHFVIRPRDGHELSRFMHWLTSTHARRWRQHRGTAGQGAVYQARYKAIPVESDCRLLWVIRYVERNACRALLVERAEEWQWCSLWQRENNAHVSWLSPWPVEQPDNWLEQVNCPQTAGELEVVRRSVRAGEPLGRDKWRERLRTDLGQGPKRGRGRPRKTVLVK